MLTPPFFASAALIVVSGWAKLRNPGPAIRALHGLRLPFARWSARVIGAVEVVVGLTCLFAPGPASAAGLAVLYTSFAVFLVLVKRVGAPGGSCGCLGGRDAPPSYLHVVLDAAAAVTAVLVAVAPSPEGIVAFSSRQPLLGMPFLIGTALVAYLAYLAAAYVPESFAAYSGRRSGHTAPSSRTFSFRATGDR